MRSKRKWRLIWALTLMMAVLLAGCQSEEKTTKEKEPDPKKTEVKEEEVSAEAKAVIEAMMTGPNADLLFMPSAVGEGVDTTQAQENAGETAGENAKAIVKMAIDNFKNRKPELVHIPQLKQKATVGYSVEAIVKVLDGVTNSQVDELGTTKPLLECITSGVIRGAVAMVGCNNPKIRPDYAHIELMKKCIANDIIIIASGCSAQAAAKAGLMDKAAKDLCGDGLKRVCELADIPPVLHMGSCVDISRMMNLAAALAKDAGLQIHQLPVVGCAPEWMSEKAVSIGNYVVGTGIDTFLGVDPYVEGSDQMGQLLTGGTRQWTGAAYTVEKDIDKLVDLMIERIEEKRTALGI